MELQCQNKKCNHNWNYGGTQIFYTNCPRCMVKVKINWSKEALALLTQFGEEERGKELGGEREGV